MEKDNLNMICATSFPAGSFPLPRNLDWLSLSTKGKLVREINLTNPTSVSLRVLHKGQQAVWVTYSVQLGQLLSHVQHCIPMDCSMPSFPIYHQLLELAQTHVCRVGDSINHLILCHPLLLLPSIFASIRGFSNESVLPIR